MDLSFGLVALALFIVAVALVILAGVGVFVLGIAAWRSFTCWIASSHVAEERRRARTRLKREMRIAVEREEAMLKGASMVATKLIHTVVESQLQHLANREADHRHQISVAPNAMAFAVMEFPLRLTFLVEELLLLLFDPI